MKVNVDGKLVEYWQGEMTRCAHFNGLINRTCAAGVEYAEVKAPGPNRHLYPCWRDREGAGGHCDKTQFPTEEQAKAKQAETERRVREHFQQIADGNCPICKKPVEKRQVGRCVYGSCGHRLYQGAVPA